MVEKHFDAFLYLTNKGGHELVLRVPKEVLNLKRPPSTHTTSRNSAWDSLRYGVSVILERVGVIEDDQVVALCRRGRSKQAVSILELPLPYPRLGLRAPSGSMLTATGLTPDE